MSLIKTTLVSVTAAIIFALVQGQSSVEPNCLGCICEASTQCNVSVGCHVPYQGAYFCGPFLISYAYWADAGKPVLQTDNPDRKGAFESCVNDLYCAAETVRQYMAKFASDCTGDGVINCQDIVRVHKIGYTGCNANVNTNDAFWQSFQTCSARVSVN